MHSLEKDWAINPITILIPQPINHDITNHPCTKKAFSDAIQNNAQKFKKESIARRPHNNRGDGVPNRKLSCRQSCLGSIKAISKNGSGINRLTHFYAKAQNPKNYFRPKNKKEECKFN